MDHQHQITVKETASRELQASSAKLLITIEGQSFFTGTEVFKKAAEVVACVSALKSCGLSEDHISLADVSAHVESGFFNKSSVARYELNVVCKDLERLGSVLAAISSQKNSNLSQIIWDYENLDEIELGLIEAATTKAKRTAKTISNSLGVPLLGVHRMSYTVSGKDNERHLQPRSFKNSRSRSDFDEMTEFDQLQLSHTTKLQVLVTAEFQVDHFQTSSETTQQKH